MASTDLPGRPAHVRDPASEKRTQILLVDISRAYLNAKTSEEDPVYVNFLMEAGQPENLWIASSPHVWHPQNRRRMAG